MDLGLEGAAAVVSGGSKGMGRATAECLAGEGASVAILARGRKAIDETVEALREAGSPDPVGFSVDTTDRAAVEKAFAEIDARWGRLNVLVNTPGAPSGLFEDLSDDDWHAIFDRATMSAVRCVRAALPLMRRAEWARIVNVSAHSTRRQNPLLVAYTAAKAALTSLSKNLAKSLAAEGILVNTVSPGTFVTASFTERLRPQLEQRGYDAADPHDVMRWIEEVYGQPADLGRAGLPEEIAAVITFLASRRNSYTTGADVNVDGGSDFV